MCVVNEILLVLFRSCHPSYCLVCPECAFLCCAKCCIVVEVEIECGYSGDFVTSLDSF